MAKPINRIAAVMLIAFMLLIGSLSGWAIDGPSLTARDDNPRRILDERRILRGAILDRRGEIIVETTGKASSYVRHSRYPDAAPFTGYYSINYGTTGVEQALDLVLRGTEDLDVQQLQIDKLLHVYPAGRSVQLTIDLRMQRQVDALLHEHRGAAVLLALPAGDILALSSQPTFDPNRLDEVWHNLRNDPAAPLLNRATQGHYQPGTALQPVWIAEALRRGLTTLDSAPDYPTAPVPIDSKSLSCRTTQDVVTLADALRAACPKPVADLGPMFGGDTLWEIAASWGLTTTNVTGVQADQPITRTDRLTSTRALREFAAGQGELTVSPLQMAIAMAALASGGEMPAPRIVSGTQSTDGTWRSRPGESTRRVLPQAIAQEVIQAMNSAPDAAWHAGVGLSGPARLLWFAGFAPVESPQYVLVVVIEQDLSDSDQEAVQIGLVLLGALSHELPNH